MRAYRTFWGVSLIVLSAGLHGQAYAAASQPAMESMLFDFENEADIKNWSVANDPLIKVKDPAPTVAWSSEGVTAGAHAMKITFNGGQWPAVQTSQIAVSDWTHFSMVKVDVTCARRSIVGFRARTDKDEPKDLTTRWEKTCFLQPGLNSLVLPIKVAGKFPGRTIVSLDIYMYSPDPGESIEVDNFRLANLKLPADPARTEFSVLGTDLKATDPADLTAKLKDKIAPAKDESRSVDQVEADFRKRYDELHAAHPKALLAILRDGEENVADPGKIYGGWKDSEIFTHPPDATIYQRSANFGEKPELQSYGRNVGSRIMLVDVSVIPGGSAILAAEMVLVRHVHGAADQDHYAPTVWVAEACNRAWEEKEVNAYQYANGKLWKELAGASWGGDDPDFLPIYLAHGPSNGKANVSTWDFTEAVKFWTDGKHENHGFFWHGVYTGDFWRAGPSRRAANIKDRPALMVIYEPQG